MGSFLLDLAKPYVEQLVNKVIAESRYICCFTCIAKDFEEEKVRLEVERATFERHIEEATRGGEVILPDARAWKEEVDQLIQEDTKKRQKCFFESCPHCLWRYTRGKFLVNKKERIKILMATRKELTIGLPAHLPDIERYTTQHYVHLKSRETQYTELLAELKDDNNYIIGLHGMGGTGKTTLIKKVGKELKELKQFTLVIVTTVSSSPNIKKIQDDIAKPLGLKFDNCNDTDRPEKLWNRLTNGEKILLILDDVWDKLNFEEIGIPSSDNHKGCRVIITTRSQLVCHKLGCNKIIQLNLISKEDAWIMFKKYADLCETTSTQFFLDRGRKIANECKNLPIAIVVIASSLKGKKLQQHREEWDMALKFLKKDISRHKDDDDVLEIYKCLKFSYDKLDEEAKNLFLLCSVFREDEEILIESLARHAIGGGLFGEVYGSYEETRRQLVISKNKLLDSCLLLEAGQRRVKMHDFVRDAAQWIANKEIQTRKVYDKNQKEMIEEEKNLKYLLCVSDVKEIFSCKFDGSKIKILIVIMHMPFHGEIEVPNSFFENNTSLRVFNLRSGLGCAAIISLPQSMQQLKNIRSLMFAQCLLGDISIFGKLQSLEELDLYLCEINELPNEIAELKKFRFLKLEWCTFGGNNPFEVIKRCSSLQELVVKYNYDIHGEITFPKLQWFHVSDEDTTYSSLSKYVSMIYSDNKVFLSETTLKHCMQEAEVLRLTSIKGEWRNIIPDIVHMDHGMNNLVELDLHSTSQLKFLIYTKDPHSQISNVFSKLVRLVLNDMDSLEELCKGSFSADSFKSLESLSIFNCKQLRSLSRIANQCNLKSVSLMNCPMLSSLFEVSTSHNLVLLEILIVIDCQNLEYLIKDERKGETFESNSSNPMFMKLKDLIIAGCPKFEIIFPLISAHDLPALKSVGVERCDKLKYIFGQYVKLGSLEDMKLGCVPNFIDIFPECNRTMSFSINRSSPISISASKPTTHSNTIKWSILSWTDMYCCGKKLRSTTSSKLPLIDENQPHTKVMESNSNCLSINIWERAQCLSRQSKIMCNIKKIELSNLKKIKSVFVLSITPKMLLETLILEKCHELKHIIIDTGDHDSTGGNTLGNVFPKLKELTIKDCMQLEYIFGHYTNDHQNHTEYHLHLSSLERVYLWELQSLVAICPKQYHITLPVLNQLVLKYCSWDANIKSFGTIMKDLLALEDLVLTNSKIESIFCVNEVNEQQVNIGLQNIELENLNVMVCPFVGPKNSFFLPNLTKMRIIGCEKLQIIFPASILRYLPQLDELMIGDCEELQHIFQDDLENQNMSSSTTCFPKLKALSVKKCNKLKYVFPVSICNQLPELRVLIITKAKELKEIFKSSQGDGIEIVRIPNLYFVATVGLPSLFQTQEIQFQRAEYRLIKNCDKLSLTSTTRIPHFWSFSHDIPDFERNSYLYNRIQELVTEIEVEAASKNKWTSPQLKVKQTQKTDKELVENVAGQVTPLVAKLPTNSEAPRNEQSVDQQSPLEETDATVTPSHVNKLEGSMSEKAVGTKNVSPKQKELLNEQSTTQGESHATIKPSQENNGSRSEKIAAANLSTNSGTKNESPIQKGVKISVEQGATSTNSIEITSSGPTVTSEHNSLSQAPINERTMDQQTSLEETDATVTPSQELINEQSTTQQQSRGESQATIKPSKGNNGSSSEKIAAATLSPISETKNESPKQKDIKISVEGGAASTNVKTLAASTSKREKLSHEYGNGQTAIQSFSISTKEPLAMDVVDHGGPLQTNQIKNLGDTSQIVEDSGSSLFVRRELEQLVSENHLNYETLSLLTDFFVKHPSILLKDALLTNRFKGYAYTCLADLLKFLLTHSVLDVLGSSHSEFVNLLQVMRNFPFNNDWLDGVEKRALFPDLQFSQDAMQKLLDSKKQVTKEVEEMRLKLYFVNQHAEDIKHQLRSSEAVLASIIKQEEQVLETTAALSVPLGY
ncbi:uncharacterized protein LOC131637508 isoform X2 [Vicia villosa]|uniref:uncharacterized protein LOC131637508 isoform X2 n=1 Tax=Vicia villosa TaxID=3911 RepID=UPI00273B2634|nr:uncharacterized protein LOC131637508 isoform X2 [Vicia villosa]